MTTQKIVELGYWIIEFDKDSGTLSIQMNKNHKLVAWSVCPHLDLTTRGITAMTAHTVYIRKAMNSEEMSE